MQRKAYLVTQWFPPEQAPIGYMIRELALELVRAGWKVTVITGFPNHPSGVVFKGYNRRLFQETTDGDLRVWRVFLTTGSSRSSFSRAVSFATFTLFSSLALLMGGGAGLIFAVLQPLSVGLTLPIIAKIRGAKLVFNVQDLHPDVPIQLGLVKSPFLIALLRRLETFAYCSADGLAVICDQFKTHCIHRGGRSEHIAVIPNWIDVDEVRPSSRANSFRVSTGCDANDFVVLYAGTIGLVSGAQIVIECAEILSHTEKVKFIFVGDGPLVPHLKFIVNAKKLKNVFFYPFQSREILGQVQAISNVSLVTLHKDATEHSVPSKVLGYMAAGRPVIAAVDVKSETAAFILRATCGLVTPPDDAQALAHAIQYMMNNPAKCELMAKAGRTYVERNCSKDSVTRKYISFFNSLDG